MRKVLLLIFLLLALPADAQTVGFAEKYTRNIIARIDRAAQEGIAAPVRRQDVLTSVWQTFVADTRGCFSESKPAGPGVHMRIELAGPFVHRIGRNRADVTRTIAGYLSNGGAVGFNLVQRYDLRTGKPVGEQVFGAQYLMAPDRPPMDLVISGRWRERGSKKNFPPFSKAWGPPVASLANELPFIERKLRGVLEHGQRCR
jgi:hypothetical protein